MLGSAYGLDIIIMSLFRVFRAFSKNKPTIFDKILDKSIPSKKVYED